MPIPSCRLAAQYFLPKPASLLSNYLLRELASIISLSSFLMVNSGGAFFRLYFLISMTNLFFNLHLFCWSCVLWPFLLFCTLPASYALKFTFGMPWVSHLNSQDRTQPWFFSSLVSHRQAGLSLLHATRFHGVWVSGAMTGTVFACNTARCSPLQLVQVWEHSELGPPHHHLSSLPSGSIDLGP